MYKKIFFIIILISFQAHTQGWTPSGARSLSLSNASIGIEDVWAYHNNPGALAFNKGFHFGYSYENRFLLKELQNQSFASSISVKNGAISLGGQFFGSSLYRNNRVGVGYSLKFANKLAVGVQINYQNLRINQYLNKGTFTGEVGILAKINSKINFGIAVFNLNQATLSSYQDDRFSTFIRSGFTYVISPKVMVLLEAEKELSTPIKPKMALEYQLIDRFFLRIGASANPLSLSFGMGYGLKMGLQIDFGSSYHQTLGWSPHVGILFNPINKNKE
ncbi:MAG: hypothetical protein HYU67_11760 [Flavobacteriia bacterium]|nr:hypothetical protein [Flavobacteriia bacterium]